MPTFGSFAGGLAEGLQASERIGLQKQELGLRQNQQAFEQKMQTQDQQLKQQEFGIKQDEATRQKAKDALGYVASERERLSAQAAATLNSGDQNAISTQMPAVRQRFYDLNSLEQEAVRHIAGQQLHDYTTDNQKLIADLEKGKANGGRDWSDVSPEEAVNVFSSLGGGSPASDWVDTPNRPSPKGQQLKAWEDGVSKIGQDGGASAIAAANTMLKGEFHGLVHQKAPDGSTITDVNLVAPVVRNEDPSKFVPTLQISTVDSRGRQGKQIVPMMVDHGRITVDPSDKGDDLVQHLGISDIFNHFGAQQALYSAVQGDPVFRDKIIQGVIDGHEDKARSMMDLEHMLGHNPEDYLPKRHIVFDAQGGEHMLAPGQEAQFEPDYAERDRLKELGLEISQERLNVSKGRAAEGKGKISLGTAVVNGKTVSVVLDKGTGQTNYEEIGGLQPAAPAAGAPPAAPIDIRKPGAAPESSKDVELERGPDGHPTGRHIKLTRDGFGNITGTEVLEDAGKKPSGNAAVDAARSKFGY